MINKFNFSDQKITYKKKKKKKKHVEHICIKIQILTIFAALTTGFSLAIASRPAVL
ncbi:hypothetical protein Hanom_Chr01g00055121 [Helianthus anomalus]